MPITAEPRRESAALRGSERRLRCERGHLSAACPPAPPVAARTVLRVSNLEKSYGEHEVLRRISLEVKSGEFVAILGPSGTGKSTLFRCIARLTEPNGGEIDFDGRRMTDLAGRQLVQTRRQMGFIFQQFNLIKRMSALDNVQAGRLGCTPLWRVMVRWFPPRDRQLALRCLDEVGMLEFAYRRVDGLSGGQQQRVAIARALCQQSRLILADEPIASLDPETALQVLKTLKLVAREHGIAVLCSLHQLELARSMADRIVGFNQGRVVVNKTGESLTAVDIRRIYAAGETPAVLVKGND